VTSPGQPHEGEQAVQRRAGEGNPDWGSPMFGPEIPRGFDGFIRDQRMLVLGAADDSGRVWSSVVSGRPGFADPVDERTIVIDALPPDGDPLREVLDGGRQLGIIALEPQTRRRIRVNGRVRRAGARLVVTTEQVLGNCPKYLQTREIAAGPAPVASARQLRAGPELTEDEQAWIRAADTFFIASVSPGHGADASHRGGMPGFVSVTGPRRLSWPDYFGNSFYMTLGNLQLNDRCGLLFLDWERGDTLQLTGRAWIDWDAARTATAPGALRFVEFEADQVVVVPSGNALRWQFVDYSRFNPPPAR
jgi:predicted pyridoxine 5'-phosphate oxidase superfamily flavin-nucleotide-binding protein